jgi:hypothetical protein
MAQISTSEEEWKERAELFNYRCRGCRERVTFQDQNLYFVQGYCAPCFAAINEKRFGPNSDTEKRLEQIRGRWGHAEPQKPKADDGTQS